MVGTVKFEARIKELVENLPDLACRFPPPWTIEEPNDACFIVKDATGQALGYFYFEDEPGLANSPTTASGLNGGLTSRSASR